MATSPFKIRANRLNAQKSTGPKSIDGKARSRLNSYKHGLTGEGVALPTEDAEAVQQRFDDLDAELRPTSVLAKILIRRVALFSIRLERCARHEAKALGEHIRGAEARFVEDRASEVDRLFGFLAAEPAAVLRRLKAMPEGVERLISGWTDLKYDLIREGGGFWSEFHRERAENLAGRHCQPHRVSRIRALTAGLRGEAGMLDPSDLEQANLEGWCRDEMARLIDAEIAGLRAHLSTLDTTGLARDRAEAADRALFDPSKDAILARKYEAAAERSMYKALDRIEEIRDRVVAPEPLETEAEAEPIDDPEPPADPDTPPNLPKGSVASFFSLAPKPAPPAAQPPENRKARPKLTPKR